MAAKHMAHKIFLAFLLFLLTGMGTRVQAQGFTLGGRMRWSLSRCC